jgi:hypothetical protein
MTHVLIATPTAGGVVKSLYATTLLKTVLAVKDAGWDVDFVTVDSAYISKARNYFAYLLLCKPHFTHLVMIDSDMSFEGNVICRLLSSDKPVVAAAYSQRRMDRWLSRRQHVTRSSSWSSSTLWRWNTIFRSRSNRAVAR